MKLIVGLGNPGEKYELTRHNIGFRVLDLLTDNIGWEDKYDCNFFKATDLILAKPQTYMNNSGKAVAQILKYYPDAELIVVHDELDFPVGSLKVMKNISSAGHNGVQSIIDEIGTKDFIRVRVGINNPEVRGQMPGDEFVLRPFSKDEQNIVNEAIEKAKSAIESLQTESLELTQSKFNG